MKATFILKADLLDIIFENRNKSYGAYPLRKYYHYRLYKALGIMFVFISILSLYILFYKPDIIMTTPFIIAETKPGHIPEKEKTKPAKTQKPKQAIPVKHLNTRIFSSDIKIIDSTIEPSKLPLNQDNVVIYHVGNDTLGEFIEGINSEAEGETINNNMKVSAKLNDKGKPAANADYMPLYPGGYDELIKFLQNNLRNPRDIEPGESISVKIKFIVGYNGVLSGFETITDGGKIFNNEVIRVLKKMPAWIPGKTAGESVSVYYTIPVKFVSQD